jgi:hypothetical protein
MRVVLSVSVIVSMVVSVVVSVPVSVIMLSDDVLVMTAGVLMRDQSIEEREQRDARAEPDEDEDQAGGVHRARRGHAFQRGRQQAEGGGGEHQPSAEAEHRVVGALC